MGNIPAIVELEGVNGDWFVWSGQGFGEQGSHLGTGVKGIYDAPVKPIYHEHAFQEGATYGGKRYLKRDLVFGVWVTDDNGDSWAENDSRLRKALSYDDEFKLWITDPVSGSRRYLKLRLAQEPDVQMEDNDPRLLGRAQVILTCTAADPWWYDEDDYTDEWESTRVTAAGDFEVGSVIISNPCDHEVYPEWLLEAPGVPRLPDYSWGDKRHNGYGTNGYFDAAKVYASRRIVMAELLPGGPPGIPGADYSVRVETRPDARLGGYQSHDQTYKQRMKMVRFLYPIPPYTEPTEVAVSMSKAPAGTRIQLRMPRPWSRPWGLEN